MAEPLSITASIVGITVPALQASRLLLQDLRQLRDAPKTVRRLVEDVQSVNTALELLQNVEEREWSLLGTGVAKQSATTISSSTQACNIFRVDLDRWTRHSDDQQLTWRDRAIVGFFKKDQVKAMSEQLQSCKLAINLIVGIAALYSSVRNSHATAEMKRILSTKHDEVKGAITTANTQLMVLEHKMNEMNLSDEEDEEAAPAEGKSEALRQLEEELNGVKASQKLLHELLSKSQDEAIARAAGNQGSSTTVTFGIQNSGFQVGVINGGVSGMTFGVK